jgi:hypothetical protein
LKIKIDFGRVLPGLLLVVAGLILLAVLIIVAFVAFLFSFISSVGGVVTIALELMLIPAVLIASGIITIVSGVTWWGPGIEGWFSGWAARRAQQDRMRVSQRVGEIIGVFIAIIIFLFLYENQLRGAAFFTSSFGSLAQFYFYAPLFTGMILSFARAGYGRRNPIRPFDCLNNLFLAVAAFWLFSAFPFDFSRFGEMFPSSIQFIFGWLNNDIGHILLAFAGIVSLTNLVYTLFLYSAVRGQLRHQTAR